MQLKVVRLYVGTFFTSLDMQGASISLLPLDSKRLDRLDAPTQVLSGCLALCSPSSVPASHAGCCGNILLPCPSYWHVPKLHIHTNALYCFLTCYLAPDAGFAQPHSRL